MGPLPWTSSTSGWGSSCFFPCLSLPLLGGGGQTQAAGPPSVFTSGLGFRMLLQEVSQASYSWWLLVSLPRPLRVGGPPQALPPRRPPQACQPENAALVHSSRPASPWQLALGPFHNVPPTSDCSQGSALSPISTLAQASAVSTAFRHFSW